MRLQASLQDKAETAQEEVSASHHAFQVTRRHTRASAPELRLCMSYSGVEGLLCGDAKQKRSDPLGTD